MIEAPDSQELIVIGTSIRLSPSEDGNLTASNATGAVTMLCEWLGHTLERQPDIKVASVTYQVGPEQATVRAWCSGRLNKESPITHPEEVLA